MRSSLLSGLHTHAPGLISLAGLGCLTGAAAMASAVAGMAAGGISLLLAGWMVDRERRTDPNAAAAIDAAGNVR